MSADPTAGAPRARGAPPAPFGAGAEGGPWFPYMAWAHTHAVRTSHVLSQSGMPPAESGFQAGLDRAGDLDHPGREALPALEAALAERFGVPRERIVVTLGATGGMFLAAAALFPPGSRVVTDVPSYEPFRALPRFFGAEVVLVERTPERGWRLDPERVRAALAGARASGHVFLANPNNPTGVMEDRPALVELARAAEKAGGYLVACDIYMEYVPPREAVFAHTLAPNTVSIGSLTKAYGLGALRIGWIVLGEGLQGLRARIVDRAHLAWVDPPTGSLRAARAALRALGELRIPLARVEAESRPVLAEWLSRTSAFEGALPPHGIIAFPRVAGVDDTLALCEYLARAHDVDVVPGEYFARAGHVRIGCGLPPDRLAEGLELLARGVARFRAGER